MKNAIDYAKFFIKKGADSNPNTYDGNMKLQKLLVLANLANIAEFGEPLFNDQVLSFENGCVVEEVRLEYKSNYAQMKQESDVFNVDFTENETYILNLILEIFGNASAQELSEINHQFKFWKVALDNGTDETGYHTKELSLVDMLSQKEDIEKMKSIIAAYHETFSFNDESITFNDITFYYENNSLTDDMMAQLESFSLSAEEEAYSVYVDNGRLVIY